jgi:hypothetical protein
MVVMMRNRKSLSAVSKALAISMKAMAPVELDVTMTEGRRWVKWILSAMSRWGR